MTVSEHKKAQAAWKEFRDAMSPQSVVLVGSKSSREPVVLPEQMQIVQGLQVERIQHFDEGGVAVQVTVRVDLVELGHDSLVARIESAWVITYDCPANGEQFASPIQDSAVYHLWPYVREFATSISARMGLEPLLLPLVTPEEIAQRFAADRSSRAESEPEAPSS